MRVSEKYTYRPSSKILLFWHSNFYTIYWTFPKNYLFWSFKIMEFKLVSHCFMYNKNDTSSWISMQHPLTIRCAVIKTRIDIFFEQKTYNLSKNNIILHFYKSFIMIRNSKHHKMLLLGRTESYIDSFQCCSSQYISYSLYEFPKYCYFKIVRKLKSVSSKPADMVAFE